MNVFSICICLNCTEGLAETKIKNSFATLSVLGKYQGSKKILSAQMWQKAKSAQNIALILG